MIATEPIRDPEDARRRNTRVICDHCRNGGRKPCGSDCCGKYLSECTEGSSALERG